jgi:hypothetical protein
MAYEQPRGPGVNAQIELTLDAITDCAVGGAVWDAAHGPSGKEAGEHFAELGFGLALAVGLTGEVDADVFLIERIA